MSNIIDDRQAYILARQMSFLPSDSGKYEPDNTPADPTRTMILADWKDHTNILIKYTPAELPPPY